MVDGGRVSRAFLPYSRQCLDEDDVAAVTTVLQGNWLTTGPTVDAFEAALLAKVGARFAVSCSSGTAALHLAALALDLGPGDAVVVPALTFLATANAARYVGADVIFADVDAETGLMREAHLREAMQRAGDRQVRAVFPVHYAGQCADAEAIWEIAEARGLAVVEDACHAIGTTYDTVNGGVASVGDCRFSHMAVFSFHPAKTVTMGEGGAITTQDESLAQRLRRLRNHGIVRDAHVFENRALAFAGSGRANPWYYEMSEMGLNYRATDIHCALGLSQLQKLERFVDRRRALAARYDERLRPLAPLVRPLGRIAGCRPAWHLYVVLVDFAAAGVERAELMARLREAGIGTQVHYIPVHDQPCYRKLYGSQALPGTEGFYARCLSLPLYPAMLEADVDYVASTLGAVIG